VPEELPAEPPRVTFSEVLAVREFRRLWLAGAQSLLGDQLARVALALLVFDRTSSAADTALVYALTYLPAILGGVLLSGLADRFPRRTVMIVSDLLRVPLLGLMAIPRLPIWLLGVALILVVVLGVPFSAAQGALLPQILGDRGYVAGAGLRMVTDQGAQVLGFAFGGAIVAALGAHWALGLDAVSFAASALIVRFSVIDRERPDGAAGRSAGAFRSTADAVRLISSNRQLWTLMGLGWLAGFYVIPEGLAAPYGYGVGSGPTGVGLLMASLPAGQALGSWVLVRFVPERRRAGLVAPLAGASGLALTGCLASPGLGVSIALWAASGLAAAYQIQAATSFVSAIPDGQRGLALGLASSGLIAIQGVGILAGGFVGQQIGVSTTVGCAGAAGAILALLLGYVRRSINRQNI
jgi:predicted MFS family arabinose efflux permease